MCFKWQDLVREAAPNTSSIIKKKKCEQLLDYINESLKK